MFKLLPIRLTDFKFESQFSKYQVTTYKSICRNPVITE